MTYHNMERLVTPEKMEGKKDNKRPFANQMNI
jgi:hypothetical protein